MVTIMMLRIPRVLSAEQAADMLRRLAAADWVDGRATAGYQSARVKHNRQVPEDDPVVRELGAQIIGALNRHPLFISAALPRQVFPPLFNSYREGESFGSHVDNAIRQAPDGSRIRTDLSATLFLTDPASYEGGELVVDDTYGVHAVKLPPGDMVLYPAESLHHVRPVTRGNRLSSFFWIQSLVRDDGRRALLFDLDQATQRLGQDHPDHPSVIQMTAVYHNLLRRWAEL